MLSFLKKTPCRVGAAFLLLLGLWYSPAGALEVKERDPAEALILSLELDRTVLLDALIAYQHQTGILLPLVDVVDALEFPIDVDAENGRAEGWFLRENRLFLLDMRKGQVTVEGNTESYTPELLELLPDGIYVDAKLLSEWFPVDLEADLPRSRIVVTSREPLPVEQRLAREQGRRVPGGRTEEPPLPRIDTGYGLFTVPKIDINTRATYQSENSDFVAGHSAAIVGDVLYGTGRLFASGDDRETVNNLRFSWERVDPDRELTFLNLSEITAGDVFSPAIPFFTNSAGGRGFTLSNFPVTAVREFDTVTLEGDLQTGWEVELYRNGSLIDFRTEPDGEGRYIFENVDLLFGRNVLRLTFYGPQGQQYDETRVYATGASSAPPGEHYFALSAVQDDTGLFDFINDRSDFEENDPDREEPRLVFDYRYGITNRISAGLAFASTSAEGERANVVRSGLTLSLGPILTEVNGFANLEEGYAGEVSTQFLLFNQSVNASYASFSDDFVSDALVIDGSTDIISEAAEMRINGAIDPVILPRFSYGLDADYEKRRSGRETLDTRNRISATVFGVNFSHLLSGRYVFGDDIPTSETLRGSLLLNGRRNSDWKIGDTPLNLSLRGGLTYSIEPESEAENISVTADSYLSDTTGLRFTVNRRLTDTEETLFTAGINREFRHFLFAGNAGYSDEGDFTLGVSLNVSLDYDKERGYLHVSPRPLADSASLRSRVFLDNNGDGLYDPAFDEPIENAKLRIGGREYEEISDAEGNVYIDDIRTYQGVNVALAENSLEDPFQTATYEGGHVVPRPGQRLSIDFPVSNTGEIDGFVYLEKDGEKSPVNKVELELVNKDGEVVKSEKSTYDGFYLFLKVLPGDYILRVAPGQVERFNLAQPEEKTIAIGREGDILNGEDFVLRARPE